MRVNTIDPPSSLEFYSICWMSEAKTITLSDVVLNTCRGNIKVNCTMKGEGKWTKWVKDMFPLLKL